MFSATDEMNKTSQDRTRMLPESFQKLHMSTKEKMSNLDRSLSLDGEPLSGNKTSRRDLAEKEKIGFFDWVLQLTLTSQLTADPARMRRWLKTGFAEKGTVRVLLLRCLWSDVER